MRDRAGAKSGGDVDHLSFSPEWSKRMSKEVNAAALGKFAEAVNTGNYALFGDVVANDCVDHDPGPGQVPGPDGYRALFTEMRQAFPDMKVDLAELVADEQAIAFAYTFTGTQNGPLMGIAPTGKKVKIRGLPDPSPGTLNGSLKRVRTAVHRSGQPNSGVG